MPRSIRLARRLMRIPWPTDGGPILFQHGFEYLQARRDDQLLELGLRINEDIDQRQVPWRRGYRLATARDCARLLLHGGSLLGGLHLGFVTGRIARPVKSRRFKFQQLLGHPQKKVLSRDQKFYDLRVTADWAAAGSEDLAILVRLKRGWFGRTITDGFRVTAPSSGVPPPADEAEADSPQLNRKTSRKGDIGNLRDTQRCLARA